MLKNNFSRLLAFSLIIIAMSLIGCDKGPSPSKPISKSSFMLGTLIEIKLYDKGSLKVIDEAFSRIAEIEAKMTINSAETSEIIKLNMESGQGQVKLSPDTFYVVERGKYYSELSDGLFDITIGPIVKLWNIGTEAAAVPDPAALEQSLRLVGYEALQLDKKTLTAALEKKGMLVDLGGIAKGYAADEVTAILKGHGVEHAIINLGGNMVVIGNNPSGAPWKIGIQDPTDPRGQYMGIAQVVDKTVVTSGTYERYFEQGGTLYHHILDPKTGYPAENQLISVSIITESSIDADALSTSTFLMGLDKGLQFIEQMENMEAIFITEDKRVYLTSGIRDSFMIVDEAYKLAN